MIRLSPSKRNAVTKIVTALTAVVVVLFSVMVALVFTQVVDRFVVLGWFWTEEIVRTLLIWSVMLGLPVVLYQHQEIVVDIIETSENATRWRLRLATVLSMIFLAILAWQGWIFTARNSNFSSPSLGISRAWLYAPIPIGAVLGFLALLIRSEDESPNWPLSGDLAPENSYENKGQAQ